jgi:hypothetical protein
MHHVLRSRLSGRADTEAALTPLAPHIRYPSKGGRRPQNVVVPRAVRIECVALAGQVREGTRCRNAVALHPLRRLNAGIVNMAGSVAQAPVSSGRIFRGGRLHNKAVNTDAQVRPHTRFASCAPFLVRRLPLR